MGNNLNSFYSRRSSLIFINNINNNKVLIPYVNLGSSDNVDIVKFNTFTRVENQNIIVVNYKVRTQTVDTT